MDVNSSDPTTELILRAYSRIRESSMMAFVGIYSTKTFQPLALADRMDVHVYPVAVDSVGDKTFAISIHPTQIQSMIRHIRTPSHFMAQILIDDLTFACLRSGAGCLTGVSNFNVNVAKRRDSVLSINRAMSSLLKKSFTKDQLLKGGYALQLSAILKEDIIIVGMCQGGDESSLKVLKDVLKPPKVDTTYDVDTEKEVSAKSYSKPRSDRQGSVHSSEDIPSPTPRVQMRKIKWQKQTSVQLYGKETTLEPIEEKTISEIDNQSLLENIVL